MGDSLSIWKWSDAPDEYKSLVNHGGDEDWLLHCPASLVNDYWPLMLSEAITGEEDSWIDGFRHIMRHEFDNGDVILGFAHA